MVAARRILFLLLIGISLFIFQACDEEKTKIPDELCQEGRCFSIDDFADDLDQRLGATNLGYAYAIYYQNKLKRFGQDGLARRNQDENIFDISAITTDMNVASCAKSITCIATLQLLDKHKLTVNTPIWPFLPSWWTIGPNVKMITFRDLLSQESGFRPSTAGETFSELREEIEDGISLSNYGQENYQNMNFCILRILIPALDGSFDPLTEMTDQAANELTIEKFLVYLQANIFNSQLVDYNCNNFHDVLYYNFMNPTGLGWDPENTCPNTGGGAISMSANDLCRVMQRARFTTELLSVGMQNRMFNETDPLGCYNSNADGTEDWGGQFHHNGGITDGSGRGARACWYTFHNGVVCAVSTNSAGGIVAGGYRNINDLIEQAFDAGWSP